MVNYQGTIFPCSINFILNFFCTDKLLRKCGLHCKVFDILCCPSPQGCLSYSNKTLGSNNVIQMHRFNDLPDFKTGAYFYNQQEVKWLFRKSRRNESSPNFKVLIARSLYVDYYLFRSIVIATIRRSHNPDADQEEMEIKNSNVARERCVFA